MNKYCFFLTVLFSYFCSADTLTIRDSDQNPMSTYRDWSERLDELENQVTENRVTSCVNDDLNCYSQVLEQTTQVADALEMLVSQWAYIQKSTDDYLYYFSSMRLPNTSVITVRQYKSYAYLISLKNDTDYQSELLLSFVKGKLGELDDYPSLYLVNQKLAKLARQNQVKLTYVKSRLLEQVNSEKRLLISLEI